MPASVPPAVVDIEDRIAERDRASRRHFWRRVAILASAAVVTVALVWGAFFSSLFALSGDQVVIESDPGRVDLEAAHQIANERVGTPLTRLSTGSLLQDLQSIPTVLDASVSRAWPRGLAIHLTPRTPVAAVPVDGGVELFDSEGVDLGRVDELPEGVPLADVPLGEDTGGILADIATIMGMLPGEILGQVETVSASSPDAIEFTLDSGATVRWGGNSENELKLAVLETLLGEVEAHFYDVSSPRSPITS